MTTLPVKTTSRVQFIDITSQLKKAVSESGVRDGTVLVFVPHTTAGVTINEHADPAVVQDISMMLSKSVPHEAGFTHSEGNSDAHIKTLLTGSSVQVILSAGSLVLGTWQGIFFCEYDGPRQRKIHVKVMPG
jgi:secondary thiamine-phosphate synthase enzyme